jgi:hypothetical protein
LWSLRHAAWRLGLTCRAILLALELERRGIRLWRDGEDIVIEPFFKLTEDDTRQLKLWKRHVLELLDYVPPQVQ